MSAERLTEISCDGRDAEICPDSAGISGYGNAAQLRQYLREEGWVTGLPRGEDRCPKCATPPQ